MKLSFEILISVVILGILTVFLNPTHLLMPDTINTMLMLGLILGFLVFVGLVWQERANDERESSHIHKSGRISFFMGSAILVVGVVIQAFHHNIDPWLIYALAGMVFTKLISRVFHYFKS